MTTTQLERKYIGFDYKNCGYGHARITMEDRGREYTYISQDMWDAIDRIRERDYYLDSDKSHDGYGPTYKQALQSLWNECKKRFNLYEYDR